MSTLTFFPFFHDLNFLTLSFKNLHFESEYNAKIAVTNIKLTKLQLLMIGIIIITSFIIETQTKDFVLVDSLIKIFTVLSGLIMMFFLLRKINRIINLVMFLLNVFLSIFLFYQMQIFSSFYHEQFLTNYKILYMFSFIFFKFMAFNLPWMLKSMDILGGFLYLLLKFETIYLDGNFFILLAMIWFTIVNLYLNEKQKREAFYELMAATSLVDKYQYLLKEVDPEINILLKQTKNKESKKKKNVFNSIALGEKQKILRTTEKFTYEVEYINSWAQEKYSLDSLSKVMEFFDKIYFKEVHDNRRKSPEGKTIKNYLQNLINPFGSRNSFEFSPAKSYMCYQNDSSSNLTKSTKKFQFSVIFCVYEWKSENYVLVRLNDFHLEEEVEELRELDKFKDQLLASVTHDLRTPLNGMIYFIKQAKESTQDEAELRKLLNYAEINGNLLMNLIGDILDRSLLKANKMRLNIQKFTLKGVLDEIMILLHPKAEFQSIKLHLVYLCKNELIVESDGDRLKQVLINLVGNAIKFTKKGFVKLRVYKRTEQFINFEVIDTGIGISKEDILRLGTPFNSYDTHGVNVKGIGLGLVISKEIIGKLGPKAELYISSKPSFGSKFAFRIYRSLILQEKVGAQRMKRSLVKPLSRNREFTFEKLTLKNHFTEVSNELEISENNIGDRDTNIAIIQEEQFSEVNSTDFRMESEISMNFGSEIDEKTINNDKENDLSPLSVKTFFERKSKKQTMIQLNNVGVRENKNLTPQKKLLYLLRERKSPLRILVVDDNLFNILIMEKFLKKIEKNENSIIINEFAHNGEIAVEKFKLNNNSEGNDPFNIIIMDCEMPIMNGFEASSSILNLINNENYKKCEIVAYSALNLDSEVKKCKEHGMNYFLCKPCNENQLCNVLYKCLKICEDDCFQNAKSPPKNMDTNVF